MNQEIPLRLVSLFLLFAAGSLAADDKIDLDRRTPVPANEPIPVADFFRPTFYDEPVINPSGTHVAALVTAVEDRHKLVVSDLSDMKVEVFDPPGENTFYNVTWLTDNRLTFKIGIFRTFEVGLYATEVGSLRNYYPLFQHVGATLIAVPQENRTRPLAWIPPDGSSGGREGRAVVVNTDIRTGRIANMRGGSSGSGESEDIQDSNRKHIEETFDGPKSGNDAGFLADKDGKLAFAFTASDGVFTMYRWVDDHWTESPVNLDDVDVLGHGRTHDEVLVRGPRKEGQPRPLEFLNAATGELGPVLLQDQAYDFYGSLYYDPASRIVLGARFDRNGPAMAWFNESYLALQKVLEGYFPNLVVRLIGADEAGRMLIVETVSDRQPPSYFWVNLEKKSFGALDKSMPWIDPQRMRPMNMMTYKTSDGKKLDAYVTLPVGASKQNPVPLVVIPPGVVSPFRTNYMIGGDRATWTFNREVQFWVSRGYAVLQPNHRGSAGYGWMFPADDEWEFTKMADDVAAATRHLLHSGLIDPKRIAISGFGFPAYLAVATAEADPDLFQAVVAFQGTYDWAKYLRAQKLSGYAWLNYGVLARHIGDEKKLEQLSVNNRVDRLHAAVLVGYQRDFGEATAQSTGLLSDLDHAKVPHESVGVGNQRSTISLVRNQVELYSRAETFLAKYLHPTPPTAAAVSN